MSIWNLIDSFPQDGNLYIVTNKEGDLDFMNMPEGCALGKWKKSEKGWYGSVSTFNPIMWTEIPQSLLE